MNVSSVALIDVPIGVLMFRMNIDWSCGGISSLRSVLTKTSEAAKIATEMSTISPAVIRASVRSELRYLSESQFMKPSIVLTSQVGILVRRMQEARAAHRREREGFEQGEEHGDRDGDAVLVEELRRRRPS